MLSFIMKTKGKQKADGSKGWTAEKTMFYLCSNTGDPEEEVLNSGIQMPPLTVEEYAQEECAGEDSWLWNHQLIHTGIFSKNLRGILMIIELPTTNRFLCLLVFQTYLTLSPHGDLLIPYVYGEFVLHLKC